MVSNEGIGRDQCRGEEDEMLESIETPRNWQDLSTHPLAEAFRSHNEEEFGEIVRGMQASGYDPDKPVVLWEGQIADGRGRHGAAIRCGIVPTFKRYIGDDPFTFVLNANLARRHLSETDKAQATLKIDGMRGKAEDAAKERQREAGRTSGRGMGNSFRSSERKLSDTKKDRSGESSTILAQTAGVSAATMKRAIAVQKKCQVLFDAMNGETLSAYLADEIANEPDLREQLNNGELSVTDAVSLMKKRRQERRVQREKDAATVASTPDREQAVDVFAALAQRFEFQSEVGRNQFLPSGGRKWSRATITASPPQIAECLEVFLRKSEIKQLMLLLFEVVGTPTSIIDSFLAVPVVDLPCPAEL